MPPRLRSSRDPRPPAGRWPSAGRLAGSIALGLALVNAGAAAEPVRILALGDSLTAGYGLPAEAAFPAVLQRALAGVGLPAEVLDAGVSGDTSAGGRARLAWALGEGADIAIVELGANDALRGLEPGALEANLDAILATLNTRGVRTLLAGMRAPRNLGAEYAERFDAVYPRVAERHGAAYYPFFLEGVAGVPELNQADGIHPNREGVEEIVGRILPVVRRLAEEVRAAEKGRPGRVPSGTR